MRVRGGGYVWGWCPWLRPGVAAVAGDGLAVCDGVAVAAAVSANTSNVITHISH